MSNTLVNQRVTLTQDHFNEAFAGVGQRLMLEIDHRGVFAMTSRHEILGEIEDAVLKYRIDVCNRESGASLVDKLRGIAVVAIMGLASIEGNGVDW